MRILINGAWVAETLFNQVSIIIIKLLDTFLTMGDFGEPNTILNLNYIYKQGGEMRNDKLRYLWTEPITYAKQQYNNRGITKETFTPRVFKDMNKSFWLNQLLKIISKANDDINTKRKVTFKMGATTYKLVNRKQTMIGFYKRLSSRRNNIFPDVPTNTKIREAYNE